MSLPWRNRSREERLAAGRDKDGRIVGGNLRWCACGDYLYDLALDEKECERCRKSQS